jgi:5-methylcytosine-specific restriction endonuclease McrA
MSKLPWFKFYPSDWRAEPALRLVSLEARGLWIEMLCIMHDANPSGHLLVGSQPLDAVGLAAVCGVSEQKVRACLHELEAAGVVSRTRASVLYSRRMVRDADKYARARANGLRGGDPDLVRLAEQAGKLQSSKRFNRKDNPTKVRIVWEACEGRCTVCSTDMVFEHNNEPNAFEIDHIIPLTLGGSNAIENLRGICKACNLKEAKKSGRYLRVVSDGATPAPNPDAKLRSQTSETRREANASVERVFDALWKLWPPEARKRHPQQKVRDAVASQLRLGVDPEDILSAGRAHVTERLKSGPGYVKGLVPWLSQGLWRNWLETPDAEEIARRIRLFEFDGTWLPEWGARPDSQTAGAQP